MDRREMIGRLRDMEQLQQQAQVVQAQLQGIQAQLQQMQLAMQCLTPEERLVVQMLVVAPEMGAADQLCQLLGVERSSVYRRRERALRKLEEVLNAK